MNDLEMTPGSQVACRHQDRFQGVSNLPTSSRKAHPYLPPSLPPLLPPLAHVHPLHP